MRYSEEEKEKIKADWEKAWDENEALKSWLSEFRAMDEYSFKTSIWSLKEVTLSYSGILDRIQECENESRILAKELLEWIQQKKLFDLQCRWRADQIRLEGIEIAYDFHEWAKEIFNCPCLSPISADEFELMKAFLNTTNCIVDDNVGFGSDWQAYEALKEAYQNLEDPPIDMPEWYDFHNTWTGNSMLMLLPDNRSKLEEYYLQARRNAIQESEILEASIKEILPYEPIPEPPPIPVDPRPSLFFMPDMQWLGWFVNTFETEEVQNQFNLHKIHKGLDDRDYILFKERELFNLEYYARPIPTLPWYNFWEGLYRSIHHFRKQNILAVFDDVYADYCKHIETGQPYTEPLTEEKRQKMFGKDSNYFMYKEAILTGRELLGEPRNFDF